MLYSLAFPIHFYLKQVSLTSSFDTTSCYQDLSSQYYVVVPINEYEKYYFISKQYWQDARNNFNISTETWIRDFDCNFTWAGWHVIIPFYETDEEYISFAGGNDVRDAMYVIFVLWEIRNTFGFRLSEQIHAWKFGYIDSIYEFVMNIHSGECTDSTTFTDELLGMSGPPQDDKYVCSSCCNQSLLTHFVTDRIQNRNRRSF